MGVYLQTERVTSAPPFPPCRLVCRWKTAAARYAVTQNAPTKVKLHPDDAVLSVNKWPPRQVKRVSWHLHFCWSSRRRAERVRARLRESERDAEAWPESQSLLRFLFLPEQMTSVDLWNTQPRHNRTDYSFEGGEKHYLGFSMCACVCVMCEEE